MALLTKCLTYSIKLQSKGVPEHVHKISNSELKEGYKAFLM